MISGNSVWSNSSDGIAMNAGAGAVDHGNAICGNTEA
jgi:hypothetical protein